MKKILLLMLLAGSMSGNAQVGVGTVTPDANAILDVKSTTKGLLIPRLSAAQRTTLASSLTAAQAGMEVADVTSGQPYYWNGTAWKTTVYTGTSPVNINATTNTVALNAGTSIGDLITWDGNNWINMQPAVQHFTITVNNLQPYLSLNYCISLNGIFPSSSSGSGADFPYIGEIRVFAFNFAPGGYAQCNGQLLPIATNTALFSLLGTTYGGNGITTFALPDLRGRVPLHTGQGPGLTNTYPLGESMGTETTTVTH